MNKFSLFVIVCCCSFSFSQVKNEKEERIKASEFPENIQNYFGTISKQVKKLKFFKETDGQKLSYEAKFKHKKSLYSIEFNAKGFVEDVEILIKKREISKEILETINDYFKSNYDKKRFFKIQKQYIKPSSISDENFIKTILTNSHNYNAAYEIIAEIKTHKTNQLKEFTFNNQGQFEKSRDIIASSYEYTLY